MSRIQYINRDFRPDARATIRTANQICSEYAGQGFDLTLRQLYYQFVARGLIANKDTEYKRLGSIINDARLAGLLDWNYITDRTRNVRAQPHWDNPADIIRSAAAGFAIDKWQDQATRIEVWIEKDALVGVLESCCPAEDVSYFSCRGYTSQSEIWAAAQRIGGYISNGQRVVILHLGDHDPSGIDMTRDITDRLSMFIAQDVYDAEPGADPEDYYGEIWEVFEVQRIALNHDQVVQYNPPPNPAKLTDSRAADYITRYGNSSWELDALDPATLVGLITAAIDAERDLDKWDAAKLIEDQERTVLTAAARRWPDVKAFLNARGTEL